MDDFEDCTGYSSNQDEHHHNGGKYIRKHITMPVALLDKIDEYVLSNGGTRSGLLMDLVSRFFSEKNNAKQKKYEILRSAINEVGHVFSSKLNDYSHKNSENLDFYPFPTLAGFSQLGTPTEPSTLYISLNTRQEETFVDWLVKKMTVSEYQIPSLHAFSESLLDQLFSKQHSENLGYKLSVQNPIHPTNKLLHSEKVDINYYLDKLNNLLPEDLKINYDGKGLIEVANELHRCNLLLDEQLISKLDHNIDMPYDDSLYNQQIDLIAWILGRILIVSLPTAQDVLDAMETLRPKYGHIRTETKECLIDYTKRTFAENMRK